MKGLQDKQQGLRVRLRNNQREIHRLMTEYENFGAVVVTGQDVPGMDEWLVNSRPKRRAVATQSPNPWIIRSARTRARNHRSPV
jgi:hypothetical protein